MKAIGQQASDILNATPLPQNYKYKAGITDESENSLKTLTTAITAMLVSIASLSLLVGGIGVMNITLVSVTERTSEIGLKKALGAKRRDILVQFLTESAVLTGVGGLIGIIVGILLAKIISIVVSLEFAVSPQWVVISIAFSLLIGIFFGVMPANKAAKLNPIDALRRE
jgi:putative ABC transport system permease protein